MEKIKEQVINKNYINNLKNTFVNNNICIFVPNKKNYCFYYVNFKLNI